MSQKYRQITSGFPLVFVLTTVERHLNASPSSKRPKWSIHDVFFCWYCYSGSLHLLQHVMVTCSGDTPWILTPPGSGSQTSCLCSACPGAPELAPNTLRTWAGRRGSARAAAPSCPVQGPERNRRTVRAAAAAGEPERPSSPGCRSVSSANQRARFDPGRGHREVTI